MTPWPWSSGTTSARDCMRGRCSVRIRKVSIFPPSKSVACHDDVTAEDPRRVVAGRELDALLCRDQGTDHRTAVDVEISRDAFPVEECDTVRDSVPIEVGYCGDLGFHDRARILLRA
jgi:hypothetical protein